jgi:hypothetical protein
MPVPSKMADLYTIPASNSPSGSEAIGNSLDDYLRAGFAIMRSTNALSSMSLASGSTVDLGTADGESVQITGTATISSFGTSPAGIVRECRFAAALTISASSNIATPAGADITVSAGDVIVFRSMGSGVWKFVCSSAVTGVVLSPNITSLTNVSANTNFLSTNQYWVAATSTPGTMFLRPLGVADASKQVSIDANGTVVASGQVLGSNLSGSNTGDQTSVSGNAGTATKLTTPRNIAGVAFDGSADIAIPYANLASPPALGTAAAANITGANAIVVTSTLPGSPDGSTLYFLTS